MLKLLQLSEAAILNRALHMRCTQADRSLLYGYVL